MENAFGMAFDDDPIEPAQPGDLEADDFDDTSDLASIQSSGFTSLDTRVRQHVFAGGRRYQAFVEGRYPLPNDEREVDREEMKHLLLKSLYGEKIYHAPIGDYPQKIIDLGTGTGLWAIEVAEAFPSATVIGVDLSPIQPSFAPPNVEWKVDDIELEWPSLYSNADFINLRSLVTTLHDPVGVLGTCYDNLRPGGWVEVSDIMPIVGSDDSTVPPDYPVAKFYDLLRTVTVNQSTSYKWNMDFPSRLPEVLQEAGFVNVHQDRRRIPIGRWPRAVQQRLVGLYFANVLREFAMATLVLYRELGLTEEEAVALLDDLKRCLARPSIHAYVAWTCVWAQKPPAASHS